MHGRLVIAALIVSSGMVGLGGAQAPPAASGVRIVKDTVTVGPSGPVGPQAGTTCPAGAVSVAPTASLKSAVDAAPASTVFCIKAGVHRLTASITPKSGQVFIGEYGAILDGTGWATADTTQAAFRAHNQNIDDVVIRNLVIRNMPQGGIRAYKDYADRWIVEYSEIANNGGTGINAPHGGLVRHNFIHHNATGGYAAYQSNGVRFEGNEFAYNGNESKISLTVGTVFSNNHLHHNINGIWYDGENTQSIIQNNLVEDNRSAGVFYEVSGRGVIRGNTIRRNGDQAVFVSTSHDLEIVDNRLEDNFRGIVYFVDCTRVGSPDGGFIGEPFWMGNVTARDNTIRVSSAPGALAGGFSYANCSAAALAEYTGGGKNLSFSANTYVVPNLSEAWWFWAGPPRTWDQWRSLGRDTGGGVSGPGLP